MEDKGIRGVTTLICLTCGKEKFYTQEVPASVTCEQCGNTVFRTFATPTEPDEAAIDALVEAKKRGVDVRVMVSGTHNDNWLARQNSVRLFGPLLRAGIDVQEYNRTMLHHKTMVVDAGWATIGTTNFDNRSFAHNEENNVCFFDAGIACAMHDTFLADLKSCDRVTLEGWRRRGVVRKTGEVIAAFLQEQA